MKRGTIDATIGAFITLIVGLGLAWPQVASGQTVTIAAAGDIAKGNSPSVSQQKTADIIGQINPAAVLPLGDDQYPTGALSDFNASYDPTWGVYKATTEPVPGNHEYETPEASGYFNYFGASAHDTTKGYYHYNLGDWSIYALNDNCSFIDCASEKSWLAQNLSTDTSLCQLVYHHTPNKLSFWKPMRRYHVDVQLSGHHHIYARYAPEDGIRRIIAGTGGYSNGKLFSPVPSNLQFQLSHFGILEMNLTASGYSWAFHDIDGTTPDSGSDTCH